MEQNTRYKVEEVPFDKLEKAGIQRDFITKMEKKELNDFLNGFRSEKLYTVNARINDEDYRIPAKIRLYTEGDELKVRVHPIQRLHIPDSYMGHTFTKEEKGALLNDKNLGKVVELQDRTGAKEKYYLGIDPKTNELIPFKQKHIRVADQIKGATLSSTQKEQLESGQKVRIDGMTGKNDKKFSAALQISPGTRSISFSDFKNEASQTEKQAQSQEEKKGKGIKVK
jgi:hypothetical protein